jgi:hypothetical protein
MSPPQPHRRWLKIVLLAVACGFVALAAVAAIVAHNAAPLLKGRILETLRASFHGRVELGKVDIAAWRGFEVTGENLRIYPPETVAAGPAVQPLVALRHFEFHAPFTGLFVKPTHVASVRISGLEIDVPPHDLRPSIPPASTPNPRDKIKILVDEIVCEDSRLIVANSHPDKGPKVWELRHIELHNLGPQDPWRYEATLVNAIPRGDIQATGNFGPWQIDSPGDTPVTGHYTFQNADLNTIAGLGGILSSTGVFRGPLDRMIVDGTTETPDFSLDSANHPVPLHTKFHAVVDGITGDTYLQPVQASLRNSSCTASGAVIDIKGRGHEIQLDINVPGGHLQDFLDLAVRTRPAVLTALIGAKAHLHIRPGKEKVVQKLAIQGRFTLGQIHFTNPQVQDKVDMLSYRVQGEPDKAKPGVTDVNSSMTGVFSLQQGTIAFSRLAYIIPGAHINLAGVYTLNGEIFDFRGHVLTDVPLSRMVQSRWASIALRAISPFFHGRNGGADIPVRISGTRSAPRFGLDLFRRDAEK